jgi:Fanconi anemia group D2 protein
VQATLARQCGILSRSLLSRSWDDNKKLKPADVIYLLQQDIWYSQDRIERIENYATTVLPALTKEDLEVLRANPLLNWETFPQFYKAMSMELVRVLSDFEPSLFDSIESVLAQFSRIVICWKNLISYIKDNRQRVILSVALKYGKAFVDAFLKKAMPIMGKHFRTNRNDVVGIFKNFQTSTRSIQALCSHVKVTKDVALAPMVPLVKKSLEVVIYEVKGMLQKNGCPSEAFFMGNLKHRDLNGCEVSADMPRDDSDEAEESEADSTRYTDEDANFGDSQGTDAEVNDDVAVNSVGRASAQTLPKSDPEKTNGTHEYSDTENDEEIKDLLDDNDNGESEILTALLETTSDVGNSSDEQDIPKGKRRAPSSSRQYAKKRRVASSTETKRNARSSRPKGLR